MQAEKLSKEIDIDDTDFIALTKHLKGGLWTGDKELYSGLKARKFKHVYLTPELVSIRNSRMSAG